MRHPQVQQKEQTIFWVETENIKANPFQPRKEFDENKLKELADSIKQYGILQPLVVVRQEKEIESGTIVEYELIAGERRLRAAKLVGLKQVPIIIRDEPADKIKLELALVENIQREDLNPVERAKAFKELLEKFSYTLDSLAKKISKSRPYVSNSLRILDLPEKIQIALAEEKINEGHTRPLLMLSDQPLEQENLFNSMLVRPMSVREAESISRRLASHRARKKEFKIDPYVKSIEEKLKQVLGARVSIERRGEEGGRVSFDFFSEEELQGFLQKITNAGETIEGPLLMETQLAIKSFAPLDHDLANFDNEPEEKNYLREFTV
ncbi:MAG: hypothetical protein A3H02_01345 [Candidatus Niyogibacteria bacterium RIFCSPLOWO2_12_FULL_41_13]|uniref:ParB-like N-terminal domain-containing protein n=1 Tax=Candidatus Niyogibacteria bacterium RIFCSPLOWO2_12_FULL_41_13 TaxID=1801726 RepID=A0A1G2F118_9BACT|nr:MAG: hypothetical protein A3H02_01345 [Candidatus Niyogibacteria bacterium RIFCSPLOWO2_12_FULL_41_13]